MEMQRNDKREDYKMGDGKRVDGELVYQEEDDETVNSEPAPQERAERM